MGSRQDSSYEALEYVEAPVVGARGGEVRVAAPQQELGGLEGVCRLGQEVPYLVPVATHPADRAAKSRPSRRALRR